MLVGDCYETPKVYKIERVRKIVGHKKSNFLEGAYQSHRKCTFACQPIILTSFKRIRIKSLFHAIPKWTDNNMHFKNFSLPTWSSKDLKNQKQKISSNFKSGDNDFESKQNEIELIESFMMNDVQSMVTVEGKNASGKSTLQRTVLLLQILVQAGCLPPCEYFESKVFQRVFFRSTNGFWKENNILKTNKKLIFKKKIL